MFSVIVMRSRDYMDSPELSHLDSLKKFFFIYLFLVALSVVVHRLSLAVEWELQSSLGVTL